MHLESNEVELNSAENFNLDKELYQEVVKQLARKPNYYELAIIDSICHSRLFDERLVQWLYSLPLSGKRIVENGRERKVDIGDGKLYSLQLELGQSLVNTKQFSSPAKVFGNAQRGLIAKQMNILATLNDIRFGNLNQKQEQSTLRQTVKSLSEYSNHFGIPIVGGELHFQEAYAGKPLINILSLGQSERKRSPAEYKPTKGDLVFMAGLPIEKDANSRSNFQVDSFDFLSEIGITNAFQERLLMDACKETLSAGVVGFAAPISIGGLSGLLLKILEKTNLGVEIKVDAILNKSPEVSSLEVLLSESSGRMLLLANPAQQETLNTIFERWGVTLNLIGEINNEHSNINYSFQKEENLNLPITGLIEIANRFKNHTKEQRRAPRLEKAVKFNIKKVSYSKNFKKIGQRILNSSNVASKQWILDQFDSTVQNNSISANYPTAAAVLRIKNSSKLLAISFDGNAKYVNADPFIGAMIAVAEAARNIIISGGTPVAMTIGLSTGDPKDPVVNWQLNQMIRGINEASRKLGIAILDLDASYIKSRNTKKKKSTMIPSPIIGMLGIIEDARNVVGIGFKEEGHLIYMIGTPHSDINTSEYLELVHNNPASPPPLFDLDEEYHIQQHIRKLIRRKMIVSAHDIMEGGLFACLVECGSINNYGFNIESDTNFRKDAYLFGESQSRIIISILEEKEDEFVNYLNAQNVPFTRLGEIGGDNIYIDDDDFGTIEKWKNIARKGITDLFS